MLTLAPSFAIEASLGRLATHLRLLGFDAAYQRDGDTEAFFKRMSAQRVALIRTRRLFGRLPQKTWLYIRDNDPEAQVTAVLAALELGPSHVNPFSRCNRCNWPVSPLTRVAARGRVPDYVWQTHSRFSTCPRCDQVFWRGSHTECFHDKMNRWFERSAINHHGK